MRLIILLICVLAFTWSSCEEPKEALSTVEELEYKRPTSVQPPDEQEITRLTALVDSLRSISNNNDKQLFGPCIAMEGDIVLARMSQVSSDGKLGENTLRFLNVKSNKSFVIKHTTDFNGSNVDWLPDYSCDKEGIVELADFNFDGKIDVAVAGGAYTFYMQYDFYLQEDDFTFTRNEFLSEEVTTMPSVNVKDRTLVRSYIYQAGTKVKKYVYSYNADAGNFMLVEEVDEDTSY